MNLNFFLNQPNPVSRPMLKLILAILVIMISSNLFTSAKKLPSDATICPKKYNPPLIHCDLMLQNPIPVCQYISHGRTRQAYNTGCDYMCQEGVIAYRNGKC